MRFCPPHKPFLASLAFIALAVSWGSESAYMAQGEFLSDLGEEIGLHADGTRQRAANTPAWQGYVLAADGMGAL